MFDSFKFSFSETNWIVTTVLGIYIWFVNKQSASSKEMLDLRLRVIELENMVKDMPSKIEIARLEGEMKGMNEKLVSTNDRISSTNNMISKVERGVDRLSTYLLENKQ